MRSREPIVRWVPLAAGAVHARPVPARPASAVQASAISPTGLWGLVRRYLGEALAPWFPACRIALEPVGSTRKSLSAKPAVRSSEPPPARARRAGAVVANPTLAGQFRQLWAPRKAGACFERKRLMRTLHRRAD